MVVKKAIVDSYIKLVGTDHTKKTVFCIVMRSYRFVSTDAVEGS